MSKSEAGMAGDTINPHVGHPAGPGNSSIKEAWSTGNEQDVTPVVPAAHDTTGDGGEGSRSMNVSKSLSRLWTRSSFLETLGDGFQKSLLAAMEVSTQDLFDKEEWEKICHPRTLIFRQSLDEQTYIHCRSRQFSRAMVWPMFGLSLYSGYSVIFADWFTGTAYYQKWDVPAIVAFNVAWMSLGVCGTCLTVSLYCHGRGCWRETRSVEYVVGAFMCLAFWPGILFGNRWRCAGIFGVDPHEVFGKYDESDGDLMLLMDAIVTYLGLFTPMRYITTVFLCLSMFFSYFISTSIAGTPEGDNKVLFSVLIVTTCFAMALYQQYHTETYKRMKFFDIYREQRQMVAMSQVQAIVTQKSLLSEGDLTKVTEDTDEVDQDVDPQQE